MKVLFWNEYAQDFFAFVKYPKAFFTEKCLKEFWQNHYRYFFYVFVIVFGLMHIANYNNIELLFYVVAPLLVVPQIIIGVILGYLGLAAGFFWGVFFHCLYNAIFIIASLLFGQKNEVISYQNDVIQEFSVAKLRFSNADDKEFHVKSVKLNGY